MGACERETSGSGMGDSGIQKPFCRRAQRGILGVSVCRSVLTLLLTATLLFSSVGCFTHRNTFGDGPQGGLVQRERVWYAFWGFLPLDDFNSRSVVGGAEDYDVHAGFAPSDVFINFFTFPVGLFRTTVRVEK